jgi:hypothetical protein
LVSDIHVTLAVRPCFGIQLDIVWKWCSQGWPTSTTPRWTILYHRSRRETACATGTPNQCSDSSQKLKSVAAFREEFSGFRGWTVTITGHQQAGGYLVNVYTPVHNTWKIRAVVFKYATGS